MADQQRIPTPGGDDPGFVLRAMTPEEVCAVAGHLPVRPPHGTARVDVRCLCGARGYRRIVVEHAG